MTLGAGVRGCERNRQVRARHPDAVIAPCVEDHVILCRHVAVHALCSGAAQLVMVMLTHIEFCRQMALGAKRIPLGAQLRAVRVVTIGAGDSGMMHAAL